MYAVEPIVCGSGMDGWVRDLIVGGCAGVRVRALLYSVSFAGSSSLALMALFSRLYGGWGYPFFGTPNGAGYVINPFNISGLSVMIPSIFLPMRYFITLL